MKVEVVVTMIVVEMIDEMIVAEMIDEMIVVIDLLDEGMPCLYQYALGA